MKKNLVTLLVALYMSGAAYAQFTIIPKAGITIASMDRGSGLYDYGSKMGLTGGVAFSFALTDKIFLQPELLFVQKGTEGTYHYFFDGGTFSFDDTFTEKYTFNYLEMPVLIKFGLGSMFYLNAGASVSYALGGKYTQDVTSISMNQQTGTTKNEFSYEGDIKFEERPGGYEGEDKFFDNRMDFGVQVGGGVKLLDKIIIDVRYGIGLVDLSDNAKSRHKVLQFTVGVPIRP